MKLLKPIAILAIACFSTVAMAERGSGEANRIVHPQSSAQSQGASHVGFDALQTFDRLDANDSGRITLDAAKSAGLDRVADLDLHHDGYVYRSDLKHTGD